MNVIKELYQTYPGDVHVLVNFASSASHMGDYAAAKKALDSAFKIAPDSAPVLINMGNYYVNHKQSEKARVWFERAEKADPYNYIPKFSLGIQELNQGRIRDGLKYITESVNLKPDFVQGYQMLATVYAQYGKTDTAHNYEVLKELFSPY